MGIARKIEEAIQLLFKDRPLFLKVSLDPGHKNGNKNIALFPDVGKNKGKTILNTFKDFLLLSKRKASRIPNQLLF